MSETYQFIIFGVCLLLSGFYSGSEAALISISVDRAKQLMEEGGKRQSALQFLIDRPTTILTTILVGNNVVNILAASTVTVIAMNHFSNAVSVATGVTTFLILIFGEIIPKTLARTHSEKLAVPAIYILRMNYYLLFPIIEPITRIIHLVLGKNADLTGRMVSRRDIEFMLNRAEQEQTIDSKSLDLLNSAIEFSSIKVKDIMVQRKEVKSISKNLNYADIIADIAQYPHSRFPVVGEDLDDVIGFLHVKDLAFLSTKQTENFDILKYVKAPFFVYEHMKIQSVFDHMNRKKVHLALVKDENGLVVGIVTLEDIMEEIFGDIVDEHDREMLDEEEYEEELLDEGIVIEGSYSLRDLYNDYDVKIPLNNNYSTITGFLLHRLGNTFPEAGQTVLWEDFSFHLETVENHEIKMVKIKRVRFPDEAKEVDNRLEIKAQ